MQYTKPMGVYVIDENTGLKETPKLRTITVAGVEVEVRLWPPSKEAIQELGPRSKMEYIAPIAINPINIEKRIAKRKAEILREIAQMNRSQKNEYLASKTFDFCDHEGYTHYEIRCGVCNERVAYVWGKDEQLNDWVDLHYTWWYDKTSWNGALAINVSPIDGRLGFECACGNDTRDFRTNKSMPPIQKALMIQYTLKHRVFGHPDARFFTVPTTN